MPKQKRWQLKRDLDQAVTNITTSCGYLVRVGSQFKDIHDDYYVALTAIYVECQAVMQAIISVRDKI